MVKTEVHNRDKILKWTMWPELWSKQCAQDWSKQRFKDSKLNTVVNYEVNNVATLSVADPAAG